jgi:hypothetical protein
MLVLFLSMLTGAILGSVIILILMEIFYNTISK